MPEQNTPEAAGSDTLLAGKYKTVEELVAAYKNAESALGRQGAELTALKQKAGVAANVSAEIAPAGGKPADVAVEGTGFQAKIQKFNSAMARLQAGDPQAAKDLIELGADPHAVQIGLNTSIDAQRQWRNSLMKEAGGPEGFKGMVDWVNENQEMSQFERDAFGRALQSGDPNIATQAVRTMRDRYRESTGYEPQQLVTTANGVVSRVTPYASLEEAAAATASPKYSTDAEYRASVERRMAISPCLDTRITPVTEL